MDHPAPSPQPVRPWRIATLVATAVAGLELVLLIVAAMILVGKSVAPHVHAAAAHEALAPKPAATATPAPAEKPFRPPHVAAKLSRAQTGVLVLNGNGVQGAAAEAASLVKARGYLVKEVGNAPRTGFARSAVMYRPGFRPEAVRFARDLNVSFVEPLDGMKPRQLQGGHLVLILGASR